MTDQIMKVKSEKNPFIPSFHIRSNKIDLIFQTNRSAPQILPGDRSIDVDDNKI